MGTQELKYKAVYNWVLDNINSGALKVGEKLPSENELSERFGLSRQTVRHAVDILEQQKLSYGCGEAVRMWAATARRSARSGT